jgi:hypothetical protein
MLVAALAWWTLFRVREHGKHRVRCPQLSYDTLHFIPIKGASGAGYQSSWGMGIKAAELVEHALRA